MPKKTTLTSLIVICITILCALWIERGSLCELSYNSESTVMKATLAYEAQ
ncbi:Hok/Gef family protein [Aliivibrio fischeri]|nr:Hok/Gef family protein [Aliivibrio fischeri]MUK76541.1 Hok/Gef family protein [Aliivibrio fischeri]